MNCSSRVSCAVVNDCNKQQKVESHRPFQERGAIARTHPHTCANVFKLVIKSHVQMKLLATRVSFVIACV